MSVRLSARGDSDSLLSLELRARRTRRSGLRLDRCSERGGRFDRLERPVLRGGLRDGVRRRRASPSPATARRVPPTSSSAAISRSGSLPAGGIFRSSSVWRTAVDAAGSPSACRARPPPRRRRPCSSRVARVEPQPALRLLARVARQALLDQHRPHVLLEELKRRRVRRRVPRREKRDREKDSRSHRT